MCMGVQLWKSEHKRISLHGSGNLKTFAKPETKTRHDTIAHSVQITIFLALLDQPNEAFTRDENSFTLRSRYTYMNPLFLIAIEGKKSPFKRIRMF